MSRRARGADQRGRLRSPVWAIGSAVVIGTGHAGVFSLGYEDLSLALDGGLAWHGAMVLLLAKLLATAVCYGLGGCGGIFAPTLFFGGMTGAAVSGLAGLVVPLTPADHVALAVVGMSACLGAVVRAPVTGILIVFEMTHEFALVPVLMIGALVSQMISRRITRANFYEAVRAQDGQHLEKLVPPRSLRNWMDLSCARVANFSPVAARDLAPDALRLLLSEHGYSRFPAVLEGRLAGVISRAEAEASLAASRTPSLEPAVTCAPTTSVRDVASKIVESPSGIIVLVGPSGNAVGVITMHDLLRAQMGFARNQED